MTPHRPPYKALKRTIMRLHLQSAREAQAAVIRQQQSEFAQRFRPLDAWQQRFDPSMPPVNGKLITNEAIDWLNSDAWKPATLPAGALRMMNGGE